ncbi:MAG: hypothetical protein EOO25_12500 [Comamonadaceae bacterium]|nr:MAG: hypothetical protein EOO25_12500 [Comamonadaceae bacterium]
MATPNYGYEKRQKELAKKRKKEDKLKAKSERKAEPGQEGYVAPDDAAEGGSEGAEPGTPAQP